MDTIKDTKRFLIYKIEHWVEKNYGSSEVEEPSWNIEDLAGYLARSIKRGERLAVSRKPYELTVLLRTDCDASIGVASVESMLDRLGGRVVKKELEGTKRLAYSIAGQEFAQYIYFEIELPQEKAVYLSRSLDVNDNVLRYLLVRQDARE